MTKHDVALVVLFLAVALAGTSTPAGQSVLPQPPSAARRPHTTEIHGYTLKDDYFWLREKSNPEVIKYLESENAYTEEVMKPTKALQETLYKEMLGRIKQTDLSVPSRHRRVLLLLAHRGREAVSLSCAGARAAWKVRKKSCSTSTRSPRATSTSGLGGIRRQRRRQLAGLLDRHDRLSAVHAAREGSAHGHGARREHRARRLGRLGDRQQDALLHDRRRGLEAVGQVLAARRRRGRERPALRGEERAVRRRGRTLARQESDLPRELRQDVDRGALPAGRHAGGRGSRSSCRARPATSTTSITTTGSSTSPPTRARRTSRS